MTKNLVSGSRGSAHINRRVTQSMFRAFDYAAAIGLPLNLYVVVRLHEQPAACASTIFTRIRHKFRDWLSYKVHSGQLAKQPPIYAYSIENPNEAPHVNWVVHIPANLQREFARKLPQWVERAQGVCGPRDINCQPVVQNRAKRLAKYIVKGTDPAFVAHFHLQQVHAPQGQVWGKRAGSSPSIGATVRRETGYRPVRRPYRPVSPPVSQPAGQQPRA